MAIDTKIALDNTVVVSKEQASADLGDEAAILNLKDGVYQGLDPVGARIWKLIQTPRTVREVRDTLLEEYDVEAERCENDLTALLQELAKNDLIDIVDDV
jgi:Coenzyme PQQ synthesis protein D (PqqD).